MDSTAIGVGIGFGTSVLGVCGVVIAALLTRSKNRSSVGSNIANDIREIRKVVDDGRPGTAEPCQKHGKKIAVIETQLPHLSEKIAAIDANVTYMRDELQGWMKQNGNS